MLVFACIGLDTRVVVPLEELKRKKNKEHYKTYVFYELDEPGKDTKYCFGYPLYSSRANIPERLKISCKIKAIKIHDKGLYEAIKEREEFNKKIKAELGINLDDPFDFDFGILRRRK